VTSRNVYSRLWFSTFLGDIDGNVVGREVAFLTRQLPTDEFKSVLDLCCGPGRHLAPLASVGYHMIGLDIDGQALVAARGGVPVDAVASFVRGDIRNLPIQSGVLDAAICMWQSFGHFDDAGNRAVLADVARMLRPRGRVVLDIYHRDFYVRSQGDRVIERYGLRVAERRWVTGTRLWVELQYDYAAGSERPAGLDEFDWRLYTPEEIIAEAAMAGLTPIVSCTEFDESLAPSGGSARMQVVFEKNA
jgi:SAM-dependent methyltransferase